MKATKFPRLAGRALAAMLTIALSVLTGADQAAHGWPVKHPVGTTIHVPGAAAPGYVLYSPLGQTVGQNARTNQKEDEPAIIYLIDLGGKVVHQWKVPFFPLYSRLQRNGNIVVVGQIGDNAANRAGFGKLWMGGAAGRIVELSWDGREVAQHDDLNMHHDAIKLPNGNWMYLNWEKVPAALQAKVRGGVKGTEFDGGIMFNDVIVEANAKGKVVWSWHANEHLDPDVDIIGPFYKREEWLHGNSLALLGDDKIVLTSRSTDSIIVIDKASKKIDFRWGNASYLDKQSGRIEYRLTPFTLGGPHDATIIPPGLPGGGNLLCYDNGFNKAASRAVEINVKTKQMVWQSDRVPPGIGRTHFSDIMGSAQRLANGNTLICEGVNGRFFQITPDNEVVWEYINPYIPQPSLHGSVFRIFHYPPDYCAQFKALPADAITPPAGTTPAETTPVSPQNSGGSQAGVTVPLAVLFLLLLFVAWRRWQQNS